MFEHIHLLSGPEEEYMKEDTADPLYRTFQRENQDVLPSDARFQIAGKVRYLLERPMNPEDQEYLFYLQTFSLMEMGGDYYTRRKDFASCLLLYTYEGKGELEYEGRCYPLAEGDGFVIDCRKEHSYRTRGDRWVHSDLHIAGGPADYWYRKCFEGKEPLFHCPLSGEYQPMLEHLLALRTSADARRELKVSEQIQRLLLFAADCQSQGEREQIPDAIRYLQSYLEHHFEQKITLDDMAQFCGLSKYHLCREFKRYTSFSPKEYLLQLRIARAKMLLLGSELPACRIGALVGIPDETNFTRLFRHRVGMTPGEYRKTKH